MEILLTRTRDGFVPFTDVEAEKAKKIGLGIVCKADIVVPRNIKFFRMYWALINLAFDAWSEQDQPTMVYKGVDVRPDIDRFRKDVTILSGFYKPVFNVKGELRLEAESISFSSMTEERFEQLFSATITTLITKVLPKGRFTEQELRQLVEQVLNFDHGG